MKKTSGSKALLKLGAKKCQNSEKKTTFFSLKKSLKTRKIAKKRKKKWKKISKIWCAKRAKLKKMKKIEKKQCFRAFATVLKVIFWGWLQFLKKEPAFEIKKRQAWQQNFRILFKGIKTGIPILTTHILEVNDRLF